MKTTTKKDLWPNFLSFSKQLIETEDLDPTYVFLYKAKQQGILDTPQLKRWLMAYWLTYHSGVCSKLCLLEGVDFWNCLLENQKKWPRGTERRHFRGESAVNALCWFRVALPKPEGGVDYLGSGDYCKVARRVMSWPLFGPWIAFKAADMLERVLDVPIDFSGCDLSMYKSPLEAANRLDPGGNVKGVVSRTIKELSNYKAPPSYNRPIQLSEVESCLCKHGSHLKGQYPIGKDTIEIRHHLQGWGPLAERLSQCLPNNLRPVR